MLFNYRVTRKHHDNNSTTSTAETFSTFFKVINL